MSERIYNGELTKTELIRKIINIEPSYKNDINSLFSRYKQKDLLKLYNQLKGKQI